MQTARRPVCLSATPLDGVAGLPRFRRYPKREQDDVGTAMPERKKWE